MYVVATKDQVRTDRATEKPAKLFTNRFSNPVFLHHTQYLRN